MKTAGHSQFFTARNRLRVLACAFLFAATLPMLAAETPVAAAAATLEDAPAKIRQTPGPIFPASAQMKGIREGEVRLSVSIDPEGRIEDLLLVAYSDRVFADEAMRAVKRWEFTPARVRGQPTGTVVEVSLLFRIEGVMVVQRDPFWNPFSNALVEQYEYRPHGLKSLDRIPVPKMISPFYPQKWIDEGHRGSVAVDFYIDETGRTRMPAVSRSDDPLLSGAAVAAVSAWQFEPPTRRGQPVLVRAQQVFHFKPDAQPAPAGEATTATPPNAATTAPGAAR